MNAYLQAQIAYIGFIRGAEWFPGFWQAFRVLSKNLDDAFGNLLHDAYGI